MGYVHYVRATCIMEKPVQDKHLYTADTYQTPQQLYKMSLEPYFQVLLSSSPYFFLTLSPFCYFEVHPVTV